MISIILGDTSKETHWQLTVEVTCGSYKDTWLFDVYTEKVEDVIPMMQEYLKQVGTRPYDYF